MKFLKLNLTFFYSTAEVRAAKAEAALEEIKKDFDTYRDEKCTHEKMISESLDKARGELTETRLLVNRQARDHLPNTIWGQLCVVHFTAGERARSDRRRRSLCSPFSIDHEAVTWQSPLCSPYVASTLEALVMAQR